MPQALMHGVRSTNGGREQEKLMQHVLHHPCTLARCLSRYS